MTNKSHFKNKSKHNKETWTIIFFFLRNWTIIFNTKTLELFLASTFFFFGNHSSLYLNIRGCIFSSILYKWINEALNITCRQVSIYSERWEKTKKKYSSSLSHLSYGRLFLLSSGLVMKYRPYFGFRIFFNNIIQVVNLKDIELDPTQLSTVEQFCQVGSLSTAEK